MLFAFLMHAQRRLLTVLDEAPPAANSRAAPSRAALAEAKRLFDERVAAVPVPPEALQATWPRLAGNGGTSWLRPRALPRLWRPRMWGNGRRQSG